MSHFYITTPIYYVNDVPHIGHAYTTIAADVLARFKRQNNFDVYFLTGTDEHGQKVEKAAKDKGLDPQDFVDQVSQNFVNLLPKIDITHDQFIRTTADFHKKAVQHLWNKLIENDEIYLGAYSGWYAVRDEAFYDESEIVDGKAPTGAPVEWVEEPSYFFRLSKWQDRLLEFYEKNPKFIQPDFRKNEVLSFVKGGLKDLSVSRTTFKWGVPVPNDPDHIMYVWLDALTNYISAVGYPDTNGQYATFWPADFHVVGKDILRFHAVYWPAFLMAADLQPPKCVFAHGWWTNEGQKISKSLGNVIDPVQLVEKYGSDAVRYFLMREVSFGHDGDFSEKALITRTNADLSNTYGNLVQRVLSFIYKNCEGKIPQPGAWTQDDHDLMAQVKNAYEKMHQEMETLSFHKVCDGIWSALYEANRYVENQKPWELRKSNPDRMNTVLYVLSEVIRKMALLTYAFTPVASQKILEILGISSVDFDQFERAIEGGQIIQEPAPIFPRIEEQ